jgi:hypothetical protein
MAEWPRCCETVFRAGSEKKKMLEIEAGNEDR